MDHAALTNLGAIDEPDPAARAEPANREARYDRARFVDTTPVA